MLGRAAAVPPDDTQRDLVGDERIPRGHYHCAACWNNLPAGVEPEFKACPLCGHGMFLVDLEDSTHGR